MPTGLGRRILRQQRNSLKANSQKPGVVRKSHKVYREEIEQGFTNAGWHIDADFLGLLIIGYKVESLSILTREQALDANVPPLFELIDHKRNVSFGVRVIPTPQQAAKLLQEYGQP
jgi:hypothetical protein